MDTAIRTDRLYEESTYPYIEEILFTAFAVKVSNRFVKSYHIANLYTKPYGICKDFIPSVDKLNYVHWLIVPTHYSI